MTVKETKLRSPIVQHMNEFCKPKIFRDRKKEAKKEGDYQEHPKHRPYKREHLHLNNYLPYWRIQMNSSEFKEYMEDWTDEQLVAYAEDAAFVGQLSTEELNVMVFELSKRLGSHTYLDDEDLMGLPIGGEDDAS